MFNFVFDREHLGRPYPNLAPMMDASNGYHGMGDTYPWIIPLRLLYFCQDHNYPVNIIYVDQPIPEHSFYPVGIGWFDYSIDYFAMMSPKIIDLLRAGKVRALFYYHEGDSPFSEKIRLDQLCVQHNLPKNCYYFISGNTQADNIENFVYFPDHELFYWRNGVVWNNRPMPGCEFHARARSKDFTVLSRVHKFWRAAVLTVLREKALLDNSFWSYNIIDMGDRPEWNPIEFRAYPDLKNLMEQFLIGAPYTCDTLSAEEHNSHWTLVREHYEDSYCNIVLETLYDCEQSNGTFLSEKTFKPIRHAQPFVVFGSPNSLATLRSLGYRTYDRYIDNSYDTEIDNTERFIKTINTIEQLKQQDLHKWIQQLKEDIEYNQQLFLSSKYSRLNNLHDKLIY